MYKASNKNWFPIFQEKALICENDIRMRVLMNILDVKEIKLR